MTCHSYVPCHASLGKHKHDQIVSVGIQSLGWVEQAACRPYTSSAADSALVSVMPEVAAGGYSPGEDSASHAVCARALKLAAQYQTVNDVQQVSGACHSCIHSLTHSLFDSLTDSYSGID